MHVIRIPCEDGLEYDILVLPPEGMEIKDAIAKADEIIVRYFEESGELDFTGTLESAGFQFLTEHRTEGYY